MAGGQGWTEALRRKARNCAERRRIRCWILFRTRADFHQRTVIQAQSRHRPEVLVMSRKPLECLMPVSQQWCERRGVLQRSLENAPHQFEAWRLHIQVKVLTFLLMRYSDRQNVTGPTIDELFRQKMVTSPYLPPSPLPFRSAAEYLPSLRRIAMANRH